MKDNRKIFNLFANVGEEMVAFEERWWFLGTLFLVVAALVSVAFEAYRVSDGGLFTFAIAGFVALATFLGLALSSRLRK